MSDFVRGYLEAALFACTDESDERGGEPLDRNFCIADFTVEAVKEATEACEEFLAECKAEGLDDAHHNDGSALDSPQGGHDFWLTACGHGCGFWDGGWGEVKGDALTMRAKECGRHLQGVLVVGSKLEFHG